MDAIADEAYGIRKRRLGFGFGFEKTLFARGGFEREPLGFELFGTLRGEDSVENDGSHILIGITNGETIHSNNDGGDFVKSISTTLRI